MKFIELMIQSLDPYSIYHSIEETASMVFAYITPVLLLIAIAARTLETQLDTTSALGKWEKALRDFFLFGLLIGSYFGIMSLLGTFINEVYKLTDGLGTYGALSKDLKMLLEKSIKAPDGTWAFNQLMGEIDLSPYGVVMTFLYWVSNLFVSAAYIFFKGAYAILYAFVFIYGLIALPMSVSKSLKLMKGWGLLLAGLMLWPIIESFFIGFFGMIFTHSATYIIDKTPYLERVDARSDFKAFFAVINVVLAFLIILAPVTAAALVANSNSMIPMVAPFASSALAVAGGAMMAGKAILPGSRMMGGLGALGGTMMAAKGRGGGGSILGGGGGSTGGGSSGSGGPSPKGGSASGASSSGGSSGGGSSSGGSSGGTGSSSASDSGGGDGPAVKSDEGTEKGAEQEAKKAKRKKSQTGHFANKARQEKAGKT